ncbi:MAG: S-layer homology domain-containing protein [Acidimicrobiia bacterium]|nr:S-layer homology domain-containing protein [Acidimicrobiia bacterium]
MRAESPIRQRSAVLVVVVAVALAALGAAAGTGATDIGATDIGAGSSDPGAAHTSEPPPPDTTAATPPTGPLGHERPRQTPVGCAHRARQSTVDVVYRDVVPPGTPAERVALDIHHPTLDPACPAAPVLVWVHGGAWHVGDKGNQLGNKQALAATYGWVLVSVNYRLSPAVTWPTHNDDVAAALDWVRSNIGAWGGDPDRVAVMGHSAGAGILAGVLADPRHLAPWPTTAADIACAVLLDTEAYDVAAAAGNPNRPQLSATYQSAFGTDPAVWVDASPLTHVGTAPAPPTLVVVGDREPRRTVNATYVAALVAADVPATLLVAPLTHDEINAAVGDPTDHIVNPTVTRTLVGCLGPSFTDVPPQHPFFTEIEALVATGAVTGFDDLTFRPDQPVSRQAMAAIVTRLDGIDPAPTGTTWFLDVPGMHPFAAEIGAAAQAGVVTGYADGTFRPTAPVSRQAVAVMLWRQAGSPSVSSTPHFADTPTVEPFRTAVTWAAEEDLLRGFADGTARPTTAVSRQALAAVLARRGDR